MASTSNQLASEDDYFLAPPKPTCWVRHSSALKVLLALSVLLMIVFLALYALSMSEGSSSEPPLCQVEGAQDASYSPTMHPTSRANMMAALRALNVAMTAQTVFFFMGGVTQYQYYSDTELYFRQESNFLYLTGYQLAGAVAVVIANQTDGYSILFVQRPDASYAIWNGQPLTIDQLKQMYYVENIYYTDEFEAVMTPLVPDRVYALPGVAFSGNSTQYNRVFASIPQNNVILNTALTNARAIKSADELVLMRLAADVSAQGHIQVMKLAKSGIFDHEYQIAGEYQQMSESCGGWNHQSYLTICGAGPRSAILHYNTNYEPVKPYDMILIDAGEEFFGYGCDITRTWPVSGKFTKIQETMNDIVLNAQEAAIKLCVANMPFSNVSRVASQTLLQGLLDAGLVNGTVDALYAAGIAGVFMPHGLGHLLGLDVHDPGVYPQLLTPPSTLQPNMVMTIEPGLYFIDVKLQQAYANPAQAMYLNQEMINKYMSEPGVGGVRIEDVVLITNSEPEVLSASVPKTVKGIEKLMQAD